MSLQGTVGAGLPVMSTLKQLLDTGDEVQRIEGIFRCLLLTCAFTSSCKPSGWKACKWVKQWVAA